MKEFTIVWEDSNEKNEETFTPDSGGQHYREDSRRDFTEIKGGIEITRAEMYDAPDIKMAFLSALATYFGTTDINVINDINDAGCETCDYGSMYGASIHVLNITQNYPA